MNRNVVKVDVQKIKDAMQEMGINEKELAWLTRCSERGIHEIMKRGTCLKIRAALIAAHVGLDLIDITVEHRPEGGEC